ncbi:MAG: hypothetical protein AAF423_05435 [Pseudomonadota bacterium]
MGNKGGRIHDPATKTLLKRKWASRRWIICLTEFRQRNRTVMGEGYTELFFLDEVSALAAGHRPCFECRRKAAKAFAFGWQSAFGKIHGSVADTIDARLHTERTGIYPALSSEDLDELPDGAMVRSDSTCFAKHSGQFHKWSGNGYRLTSMEPENSCLITPISTVSVLKNGYMPVWHPRIG